VSSWRGSGSFLEAAERLQEAPGRPGDVLDSKKKFSWVHLGPSGPAILGQEGHHEAYFGWVPGGSPGSPLEASIGIPILLHF